jgi:hypothetical protein
VPEYRHRAITTEVLGDRGREPFERIVAGRRRTAVSGKIRDDPVPLIIEAIHDAIPNSAIRTEPVEQHQNLGSRITAAPHAHLHSSRSCRRTG